MILYIIQSIVLLALTIALVLYFSHSSTPIYVRILVMLSFYLSFVCFLVLPMDIYQTNVDINNDNKDNTDQKHYNSTIMIFWTIIYDINAILCWLVLPIIQEYEDSGQFTKIRKFKQALRNNGIMMLAIFIGAIALVIYLIIVNKFTIQQLPSIFATIVNIFGMSLVSMLLGFGLVSFPKQNYMKINYKRRVNKCHRLAQMLKSQQQLIKQQIFEISRILEIRQRSPQSDNHQATILYLIQENINFNNFRSYADRNQSLLKKNNPELHTIIKKRLIQYHACQSELDQLVDELRDVSVSFSANSYTRMKYIFIILFSVTTLISLMVFLAQTSTFISVFSYVNVLSLINWSSPASYVMNCLLLIYIAYIVTHTVFRIKLYRTFSLHKKHSSSSSLTFTAINLARISFPLCYNYLQITHIKNTAFLQFFGQINLNSQYAFVFPIVMIIFGIFNLFDIYDTIMGYLGLGSYAFDQDDEKEKAEEGQKILVQRLKERNIQNHKMEMIQLL